MASLPRLIIGVVLGKFAGAATTVLLLALLAVPRVEELYAMTHSRDYYGAIDGLDNMQRLLDQQVTPTLEVIANNQ